jgi:hypothetical protein
VPVWVIGLFYFRILENVNKWFIKNLRVIKDRGSIDDEI